MVDTNPVSAQLDWQVDIQKKIDPYLRPVTYVAVFIYVLVLFAHTLQFEVRHDLLWAGLIVIVLLLVFNLWALSTSTRQRLPAAATPEELAAFEKSQAAFLESIRSDLETKARANVSTVIDRLGTRLNSQVAELVATKIDDEFINNLDEKLSSRITDTASKNRLLQQISTRAAQAPNRHLDFAGRAERSARIYQFAAIFFAITGIAIAAARMMGWMALPDASLSSYLPDATEKNFLWIFAVRNAPVVGLVLLVESISIMLFSQSSKELERTKYFSREATNIEKVFTAAAFAVERGTPEDATRTINRLLQKDPYSQDHAEESELKTTVDRLAGAFSGVQEAISKLAARQERQEDK